jgi:perosamine synthetase
MTELGYNYRLPDVQCALGLSQLSKLDSWLRRRRALSAKYNDAFRSLACLRLPFEPDDRHHAWHLYTVRLTANDPEERRRKMFVQLRASGIGVNVHYIPVYHLTYYRSLGYQTGLCPEAERAYKGLLSLPMWHGLSDGDHDRVTKTLADLAARHD